MAITVKTWAARDLEITWGEISLEGPSDGSFVNISYDEDMVVKHTGAQGMVTACVMSVDGGAVTWTAGQLSPANDPLSVWANIQRKTKRLIKKPMLIKHVRGTSLYLGAETWIKKEPDAEFAAEHSPREWSFDIAVLEGFTGGSTS